jgi:hypothetical protein
MFSDSYLTGGAITLGLRTAGHTPSSPADHEEGHDPTRAADLEVGLANKRRGQYSGQYAKQIQGGMHCPSFADGGKVHCPDGMHCPSASKNEKAWAAEEWGEARYSYNKCSPPMTVVNIYRPSKDTQN